MDARRGIVTPEGVLLEFDEAGVASRTLAIALDLLVQLAAFFAFVFAVALASAGTTIPESVAIIIFVVAIFAILFGYPIGMETLTRGRTLGKMALGLRVVTATGAPISFRHAFIRSALGLVDFYLVPFGVVATVSVLLSRRRQRLGDLVAGTIVVRERQAGHRIASYTFAPPPGYEAYAASLDVSNLGDDRYALVRSFLLRAWDLAPNARHATSHRLANAVARHLNHTPPPQVTAEYFLVCVAAAYQARRGGASASPPAQPGVPPAPPGVPGAPASPAPPAASPPPPPAQPGGFGPPPPPSPGR